MIFVLTNVEFEAILLDVEGIKYTERADIHSLYCTRKNEKGNNKAPLSYESGALYAFRYVTKLKENQTKTRA